MSQPMRCVRATCGALGFLLLGCAGDDSPHPETAKARVPVRTAPVQVLEYRTIVRASGTVAGQAETHLGFRAGGTVERIDVDEGDLVERGEELASLDRTEVLARLTQAGARFDYSDRELIDNRKLRAAGSITGQALRAAERAWEETRGELAIARHRADGAVIQAPASGRILRRLAEPGEVVEAGRPLLVFESAEQAQVLRVAVAAGDLLKIGLGDSASVVADADTGRSISAAVSRLPASRDPRSGMFEVELVLVDAPGSMPSGLLGRARIFTGRVSKIPAVPVEALTRADGNRGVVFTLAGDVAHRRQVTVGAFTGDLVMIPDGLAAGETVVTEGARYLSDLQRVDPVDAGSAAPSAAAAHRR